MKKVGLIFILGMISFAAKAQTFNETQARVELQSAKLEKELKDIEDRIIYLEVTIPEKIMRSRNLAEIQQLKKEIYFSSDKVTRLRAKKTLLENALTELTKTGLDGIEYRTEADLKSNLPERINQREYAQRVRANDLKSETTGERFEGVIVNHKAGQGEIATIIISRRDVSGLPPELTEVLLPGQEMKRTLPAGKYVSVISCGSFRKSYAFDVIPKHKKGFEGKDVYWASWKDQNDF